MNRTPPADDGGKPKDGKPFMRDACYRHATQSGQATIHGMTNYEVNTQEGQRFGFYSGTGKDGDKGGPGTGKCVLNTPGQSLEVLGTGLKVRGNSSDDPPIKGKYVLAKRGDIVLECEDGDIILKAKNIRMYAEGGGKEGNFTLEANKLINMKAPDVRAQAEKLSLNASQNMNIISDGFMEITYGFAIASSYSDYLYGVMSKIKAAIKLAEVVNPNSTSE